MKKIIITSLLTLATLASIATFTLTSANTTTQTAEVFYTFASYSGTTKSSTVVIKTNDGNLYEVSTERLQCIVSMNDNNTPDDPTDDFPENITLINPTIYTTQ